MSARDAAEVVVHKGELRAGVLSRTPRGAQFRYDADYLTQHLNAKHAALAFSLPLRDEPYVVSGVNLHPFFAGLLPEGLRLRSLVQRLKTSEDDLFSLLVASGGDAIGDVWVARTDTPLPEERAPLVDVERLDSLSFEDLFQASLRETAREPAVAGVQPKLSAAMISFPIRAQHKRRAYLLKLTPAEYPKLSENEAFFMQLTKRCGISVAATRLVYDKTGRSGLLVERFDRAPKATGGFERLHQEDACQLLDRYPADKYLLSLAEIAEALEVCSAPLPERLKLFQLQALSYLIANGDMHAKNVSIYVKSGRVTLTPAYDVLSTLPYGDDRMALKLEGRDAKLKPRHFIALAARVGVTQAAVEQMLRRLCERLGPELARLSEIGLPPKKTEHLAKVMRARLEDLSS